MVSLTLATANNNGLTHDNDKRRKQTVERAKANHLSRQLQMCLQYARLKVDHGWQKQNLNEVENLYFHHSHQRGSKPYNPSPSLAAATTTPLQLQEPTASYSSAPATTSSLSFKLGQSSLSRSQPSSSLSTELPWRGTDSPSPSPNTLPLLTQTQTLLLNNPDSSIDVPEIVDETNRSVLIAPQPTTSGFPEAIDHGNSNLSAGAPQHNDTLPPPWNTMISHLPAPSSNHYPNVLHRQPTMQPPPPFSTGIGEGSFNFSSTSLTYDSFWSSHPSSTGSRSFRPSPAAVVDCSPSTDVMMSITETINVGGVEQHM